MKELIEYQKKISLMDLEQLLNELVEVTENKQKAICYKYNNVEQLEQQMLLIKMEIYNRYN